jgi:hypothetical protein
MSCPPEIKVKERDTRKLENIYIYVYDNYSPSQNNTFLHTFLGKTG